MNRFFEVYWGIMLKAAMKYTGVSYFHCTWSAKGNAMAEWEKRRSNFWFILATRKLNNNPMAEINEL